VHQESDDPARREQLGDGGDVFGLELAPAGEDFLLLRLVEVLINPAQRLVVLRQPGRGEDRVVETGQQLPEGGRPREEAAGRSSGSKRTATSCATCDVCQRRKWR
jgi:hypothetical protein